MPKVKCDPKVAGMIAWVYIYATETKTNNRQEYKKENQVSTAYRQVVIGFRAQLCTLSPSISNFLPFSYRGISIVFI